MHVLDANDIFGITAYTFQRIQEMWWKARPDAFALYFRYLMQSRMQQTNQTLSLNKFMQEWMWWWWDTRIKNARDTLKSLWLIDDITIRDEKWKIKWHYVRVNYLINEEKVRSSSINYELSIHGQNQDVVETRCGHLETNALSNKDINALNNKDKIFPEEEDDKNDKKDRDREETINTIQTIKETAEELWIAYENDEEWKYAKHIATAKEYWKLAENLWISRIDLAISIMKASITINYFKWACGWPKKIYTNYADIYNRARNEMVKTQKTQIKSF